MEETRAAATLEEERGETGAAMVYPGAEARVTVEGGMEGVKVKEAV
jgi:hypothetical protein